MWKLQLISLYCAVCDNDSIIEESTQRQSNNFRPEFTDEECITVYMWGTKRKLNDQKAIYDYTKEHLSDWFPKLPSYQAFNRRLTRLAPAFQALAGVWTEEVAVNAGTEGSYVTDSFPIVLAKQTRAFYAKVAPEMCGTGYNSTKKEYYYGVKLHVFAARHAKTLPTACSMMISPASQHDLPAAKQTMADFHPIHDGKLYADKAYIDEDWEITLRDNHHVTILTPRKKKKTDLKGGNAFSTFVSSLRQQIECFFNWLNANTGIQTASKVRSSEGLLVHIFGKIATAIYFYYFNS